MANPKGRFGKSRTRKRRANWKMEAPRLAECPKCHSPKLPHRVCPECGFYNGREVIKVKEPAAGR
ncbi:MAG TPA: 50S ribosomal protein L32 [Firmicutes bacterium]|nr:50S ribosomal protein L32 [Bacillota bacterium]HHY98875.1 50S ribosomal protein L32 [Bacillota bacterium]